MTRGLPEDPDPAENSMYTLALSAPSDIQELPLRSEHRERPSPGEGELLLRVRYCGVCRTDLHIVEGDITPPRLPIVPGHQIVGEVIELGAGVEGWRLGDRAGVPWLFRSCGLCAYCRRGEENLCPEAQFTGFDIDGGYAEFMIADAGYALRIPVELSDLQTAPLLCAGVIGYRSLRLAEVEPGERLGLVGFGASAHLAIQVARHWSCEVYVFTRSESHRRLAAELGAAWTGGAEDKPPTSLDAVVLFAPAGELVPVMLARLRPGGTLAINAIHMSPLPEMPYALLYGERTLRSVTNLTRRDGQEFLELAAEIPIQPTVRTYPLNEANQALQAMKQSRLDGAAVLEP